MLIIEIQHTSLKEKFKIKITEEQIERLAAKLLSEVYTIRNESKSKESKR